MSDNFHFDITGASLEKSLDIATTQHTKVAAWSLTDDGRTLLLHWTTSATGAHPLPAPLTGKAIVEFVRAWLTEVDYGPQPRIDVSASKGWRVFNEDWTHVDHTYQAFIGVQPAWLLHGK